MNALVSLVSFRGRINRRTFLIRLAAFLAIPVVVNEAFPSAFRDDASTLVGALQFTALLGYVWCIWANSAKRWHDTDRSAVYTAVMIVPVVGLWLNLLVNALAGGTYGPNRFGDPPA